MTSCFPPEGRLLATVENKVRCASLAGLRHAMADRTVVEGTVVLCDAEHNLLVSLGGFTGIIPREETALGIADGSTREIAILSRVGKPAAVLVEGIDDLNGVIRLKLSRRAAQRLALDAMLEHLRSGDIIPAVITHLEPFGAFVDIGCGVSSMIGIENISVSRIPHPGERFFVGQLIRAVVLDLDPVQGRIYLTHKELLGTWAENADRFKPGTTVTGMIRGLKDYGAFVELAPNLSGLAELRPDLREGDRVSVYLKAILPQRMKLKLLVIDRLAPLESPPPLTYFCTEGRLAKWKYAPACCTKISAETVFA